MARSLILLLLILPVVLHAAPAAPTQAAQLREQATRLANAEGVARDLARAHRLYCTAALQGDAEAMYQLGWMYLQGRGIPQDDGIAKDWLIRAHQQGDPYAKRLLDHLPMTTRQADPRCIPSNGKQPSRTQITAWVHIMAPEYQLDPKLVLAVIAAESNFDNRALSHRNAHGLMQLIPSTARRFQVADIWHPVDNLRGGMAYLNWLMRTFNQDLRLSLAAYNAGEDAVQRYGGIPPYAETRAYVQRIMTHYHRATPAGG